MLRDLNLDSRSRLYFSDGRPALANNPSNVLFVDHERHSRGHDVRSARDDGTSESSACREKLSDVCGNERVRRATGTGVKNLHCEDFFVAR